MHIRQTRRCLWYKSLQIQRVVFNVNPKEQQLGQRMNQLYEHNIDCQRFLTML